MRLGKSHWGDLATCAVGRPPAKANVRPSAPPYSAISGPDARRVGRYKPRIDTPGESGKGQIATSGEDNTDPFAQFTQGLEQLRDRQLTDPQRPTWALR